MVKLWRYVQLFILVALAFQSLLSVLTVRKSNEAIHRNQKTLAFLCATSNTLATVLDGAADQTSASLKNGSYKQYATKKAVEDTRDGYRAQAKKLRNPHSPCKKLPSNKG